MGIINNDGYVNTLEKIGTPVFNEDKSIIFYYARDVKTGDKFRVWLSAPDLELIQITREQ